MQYVTLPESNGTHNTSMSVAKGIAIILMVIGHTAAPVQFVNWFYTFHMPLFFIISGYFFHTDPIDRPVSFVKKKIKGLYWPLVKYIWAFILIRNLLVYLNLSPEPYSFAHICRRMITAFALPLHDPRIMVAWFVISLLCASLIVFAYLFIVSILLKKKGKAGLFNNKVLVLSAIGFSILSVVFIYSEVSIPYLPSQTALAGIYLMVGMLYRRYEHVAKAKPAVILSFIMIAISIAVYAFVPDIPLMQVHAISKDKLLHYIAVSVPMTLAVINAVRFIPAILTPCFDYIGRHTLIILMLHMSVLQIVCSVIALYKGLPLEVVHDCRSMIFDPTLTNPALWPLFTAFGVIIPLLAGHLYNHAKQSFTSRLPIRKIA